MRPLKRLRRMGRKELNNGYTARDQSKQHLQLKEITIGYKE